MSARIVATAQTPMPQEPVADDQVQSGSPVVATVSVDNWPCGLWTHSVGASTDVEADEVFVVLAGRATIEIADQAPLSIGPGDVVELTAGTRTVWHVSEPLRKFWVTRP